MTTRLSPYPKYRHSHAPWVGDIPSHWGTKPLKHWVRINGSVLPETTAPDYEFNYLDIGSVGTGILTQKPQRLQFGDAPSRARRIVRKGDTVLSTVRTYLKAVYFVAEDTKDLICSTGFAILTPKHGALPEFVSYLVRSNPFTDQVTAQSIGIAYPAIAETRLGSFYVVVPPIPEQSAIVLFLDRAGRRISRFIKAKQRLIKLLEEQKQVIIFHAVTRGLDPNVRFKPSGIEWLGDVPEHWEIARNGRLFSQRNETGFPELPILEVSIKTGVRIRDFESSRKQVMTDRGKYKRAAKGDIAYNMMRMWQGAVGVAPVDGLVSPAYVVARPLAEVEPRYFAALFRTSAYMDEVDKYSHGIVKDRNRLYWEDFKQMPTICPPLDEQVKIADDIEQRTASINESINRIQNEISLLREYRTRLISDIVTGKLDVRGVELPELDEADALDAAESDEIVEAEDAEEDTMEGVDA